MGEGGGGVVATAPAHSVCLILESRRYSDLKIFFMDRCVKDQPTAKNFLGGGRPLWKKAGMYTRLEQQEEVPLFIIAETWHDLVAVETGENKIQ